MPRFIDIDGGTPIASAADARAALGSSEIGDAVFTAADAAEIRTLIGGSAVGQQAYTAASKEAARAAINAAPSLSDLHTSFRDKGDSEPPSVGDEGIGVVLELPGRDMQIKDGLLQDPSLDGTTAKASYWNQQLDGVTRIGATFKIETGATNPFGSVTLVLWEYPIPRPYKVPNSPFHLSICSTFWELTVWEGGDTSTNATTDSLITKYFDVPLADDWDPDTPGSGTLHRVEAVIDGDTATIVLPDGTVETVTDPRIASIPATIACHEIYMHHPDAARTAFQDIWAGTQGAPIAAASTTEAAKLIRRSTDDLAVSISNNRPVYARYSASPAADIAVPTTITDITGLPSITFTMPDDCTAIEVEASLYYVITASSRILVCFQEGATAYDLQSLVSTSAFNGTLKYTGYRTGIFPGTTHTITLKHRVISGTGAVLKLDGPNGYIASWKVTPVKLST